MNTLFSRIGRRIKYTWTVFRSDCHFSLYYACLRMMDEIGGRLGAKKLSDKAHDRKDRWIIDYLEKTLKPVIDKMRDVNETGTYVENAPIWICWWTGEETAPPLVQKCISSIRENAGNHPVYLITENNYCDYLTIPDYMLDKVHAHKMGLAHLSDYIRSALLAAYGGLWLDATIFCSQTVPEEYFLMPVFTCKSPKAPSRYISELQWTTFVLGGWKGNVLYRYLKIAFESYWKENNTAIDYLFFDYLIKLAKEQIPSAAEYLDAVPFNNLHRDDLQAAMNAALPASAFDDVIQPDTCLYKLSWREQYAEATADGQETVYSYFINNTRRLS